MIKEAYAMESESSRANAHDKIRRVESHSDVGLQDITLDRGHGSSTRERFILHGLDKDTKQEIYLQMAAWQCFVQPEKKTRARFNEDVNSGQIRILSEQELLARILSSALAEQKKQNTILEDHFKIMQKAASGTDKIAIAAVCVAGFSFLTSLTGLILNQL
jgi:hypothetical protein